MTCVLVMSPAPGSQDSYFEVAWEKLISHMAKHSDQVAPWLHTIRASVTSAPPMVLPGWLTGVPLSGIHVETEVFTDPVRNKLLAQLKFRTGHEGGKLTIVKPSDFAGVDVGEEERRRFAGGRREAGLHIITLVVPTPGLARHAADLVLRNECLRPGVHIDHNDDVRVLVTLEMLVAAFSFAPPAVMAGVVRGVLILAEHCASVTCYSTQTRAAVRQQLDAALAKVDYREPWLSALDSEEAAARASSDAAAGTGTSTGAGTGAGAGAGAGATVLHHPRATCVVEVGVDERGGKRRRLQYRSRGSYDVVARYKGRVFICHQLSFRSATGNGRADLRVEGNDAGRVHPLAVSAPTLCVGDKEAGETGGRCGVHRRHDVVNLCASS